MTPNTSHLIAAGAPRLLAVPVVASTVQLAFLPEVDHVHQQLFAGTAHEAGWVPQIVVAGPLSVDGRLAPAHWLPAVLARLKKTITGRETVGRSAILLPGVIVKLW